jgi:uncharacterized protein (TIGR03086 family)
MPNIDDETLGLLARALEQAQQIVGRVRADQLTEPTPCRSWDVRTLVGHVMHDMRQYQVVARGGDYGRPAVAEVAFEVWSKAARDEGDALLVAWRARDDVTDKELNRVNQEIAEFAIHGWDVARATGQDVSFDAGVTGRALGWARENLRPEYRGDEQEGFAFGPEVLSDDTGPAADRLAAFFGRDPSRWPA